MRHSANFGVKWGMILTCLTSAMLFSGCKIETKPPDGTIKIYREYGVETLNNKTVEDFIKLTGRRDYYRSKHIMMSKR